MPPSNPTATITFDYNNGNPLWSVDHDPLPIPHGNQTVIWRLHPSSTSGADFASTNGIVFDKPGPAWPGTQPTASGSVYRSTENNNNPGPGNVRYSYSVNVTYTPSGGAPQTFTWDPDVENEPPVPPVGEPPKNPPGGGGQPGGGQPGGGQPGGGQPGPHR
jgi:hypothetical protein